MNFGERLRELREEKNITQKALAEYLCVSPRMISFYEGGTYFVSDEKQLVRLADFFGVTTDYLLGRSDIRSLDQLAQLNRLLKTLPADERKTVLDFARFLCSQQTKKQRP